MRGLGPLAFLVALLAAVPMAAPARASAPPAAFDVEDYFRLQRITELALSPDGRWLAYLSESLGPAGRRLQVQPLSPAGPPRTIDTLAGGRRFAWIPGNGSLAFLRSAGNVVQLFAWDPASGSVRQLTRSPDSLVGYAFAPGGTSFAYVTRAASEAGASLYDRFRNDRAGIIVDPATTSSHDFLNPEWNALVRPPPLQLWVAAAGRAAIRVPVPGEPTGTFAWSSDGGALSVTFVGGDTTASRLGGERTSVGIFDPAESRFDTLAPAVPPRGSAPGIAFEGGEWIPGERRLLLRRITESDPWVSGSFPDWAVADVARGLANAAWRSAELYPSGLQFYPRSDSAILAEATVRGVHSLFELAPDGLRPSPLAAELEGSATLFAFGADLVVFVGESLARPPELFVRRAGGPARQITHLNDAIAARVRHRVREVRWRGRDGVEIAGWLLEPVGAGPGPWPLVTHVHGGPAFPFPNAFAPYFDFWPYPLEVYAAHGMAVFLPNYRGTQSYGRRMASPVDQQPVEDIIAGIDHLVAAGIADPARLGISGHSHGAMLGPLVMGRARRLRAASFAEGVANAVVMYELMSGDANREIHDPVFGASLYEAPERYLAESGDLHLAGVSTASLFEAGARTSALFMLGFPKAAHRFGMPTEFVVYPNTAHNIVILELRREAATRNLDWFDFWLRGRENPGADKSAQYARWRTLRNFGDSSLNP